MSGGPSSNYVVAKEITQKGQRLPKPGIADVWLGGIRMDDDGKQFVALEIQPAYGTIAMIRLSLAELKSLRDLIDLRLGMLSSVPVKVVVPPGTEVEVTYI